jgi:hypothetical protein
MKHLLFVAHRIYRFFLFNLLEKIDTNRITLGFIGLYCCVSIIPHGHIFGMVDLYNDKNKNKLMYGNSNRTVSVPQAADLQGMGVITGYHTLHSFVMTYYNNKSGTMSNGLRYNQHRTACGFCRGWQHHSDAATCNTSGAGRTCTVCGIHRNGNVSQSGEKYSPTDVLEILKIEAGMGNPTPFKIYLADVDGAGKVTTADAELILARLGQW